MTVRSALVLTEQELGLLHLALLTLLNKPNAHPATRATFEREHGPLGLGKLCALTVRVRSEIDTSTRVAQDWLIVEG